MNLEFKENETRESRRKWKYIVLVVGLLLGGFGLGRIETRERIETTSREGVVEGAEDESMEIGTAEEGISVNKVIDGDTVKVELLGEEVSVRLIGIDAPEVTKVECFGREATEKLKELVLGRGIEIEKDKSDVDRYGRKLGYIYVGEVMINEAMIRMGYAKAYPYPPDTKFKDVFAEAENEAREKKRGLWGECVEKEESQVSKKELLEDKSENEKETKPSDALIATAGVTPTEADTPCLIKGNISSGGKIYHLPGCGSYEKTAIDTESGERWFCSEQEAEGAGWRKAKNC